VPLKDWVESTEMKWQPAFSYLNHYIFLMERPNCCYVPVSELWLQLILDMWSTPVLPSHVDPKPEYSKYTQKTTLEIVEKCKSDHSCRSL